MKIKHPQTTSEQASLAQIKYQPEVKSANRAQSQNKEEDMKLSQMLSKGARAVYLNLRADVNELGCEYNIESVCSDLQSTNEKMKKL